MTPEPMSLVPALRNRAVRWRDAGFAADFGGSRPTALIDTICTRLDARVPTELRLVWEDLGWIHVSPGLGLPGATSSAGSDPADQSDVLAVHAWLGPLRPSGSIVVGLDAEDWAAPAAASHPYVLLSDGTVQILSASTGATSPCASSLEQYLRTDLLGEP